MTEVPQGPDPKAPPVRLDLGRSLPDGAPVLFPAKALKRHMVCIGSTGSGKTVFCKLVCEQALALGIPVIAVDPQGDLASMARTIPPEQAAAKKLNVLALEELQARVEPIIFTPASNAGVPICANPFASGLLADQADPIRLDKSLDLLAEVIINHLKGLPKTKLSFFQGALLKVIRFAAAGGHLSRLDDVLPILFEPPEVLAADLAKVIDPRNLDLLRQSFQVMLDSPARYLFDYGVPLDVDLLIGRKENPENKTRLSIIYLNSLNTPQDKEYFVSLLIENLYQWMIRNPIDEDGLPQMLLFIDEIGTYLPPQNQAKPVCKDILITLFKQARKYGVVCLGASQSPGDFDYRALGQTNAMNVGRLKTPQECKKVEQIIQGDLVADPENVLPQLRPGEFFLWAPDAFRSVVRYQSPLSLFELATVSETEIGPYLPEGIRERFAHYCRLPEREVSPGQAAAPSSEELATAQGRLKELEVENARLKAELAALKSGPAGEEKPESALEEMVLSTLDRAAAALTAEEIVAAVQAQAQAAGQAPAGQSALERTVREMAEAGRLVRVKDGRKYRYHAPDQEFLPQAGIFEPVLFPEKLGLYESEAEKVFEGGLDKSFLGRKREEIESLDLFNYPVWALEVTFERKKFFGREDARTRLYLDALKGNMLELKDGKFSFKRNHDQDLDDLEKLEDQVGLVPKSPTALGSLPQDYFGLIGRDEAARIVLQKHPVKVEKAALMFLPFWQARIRPVEGEGEGEGKPGLRRLDAVFGAEFSPPVPPGPQRG